MFRKHFFKDLDDFITKKNISINQKSYLLVLKYSLLQALIVLGMSLLFQFDSVFIWLAACLILMNSGFLYLTFKFGQYKVYALMYCLVLNFLVCPTLFVISNGMYSGGLLLLCAGLLITYFILEKNMAVIVITLETVGHIMLLVYSYVYRERFNMYQADYTDPVKIGIAAAISFLLLVAVPLMIVKYQSQFYKNIKENIKLSEELIANAEATKSRFLANMTHEIRTPMNAIVGMNELILKENLNPIAREQAEIIKASSAKLLTIINNILMYSKLESNKVQLYQAKYSFRKLITEVIHTVSVDFSNNNTDFQVYIDSSIPEYLYGDEVRIKQVFMYLLFSYLHQLSHGKILLDIAGERNPKSNEVILKCKLAESGQGITEEELDAVLGAYTKYDSRQQSDYKGMGLELAICREILNVLGSELKIESIAGVGMAISFEIANYIMEAQPMVKMPNTASIQGLVYLDLKNDESVWKHVMEDFRINPMYVMGPGAFKTALEERKYTHIFIPDSAYELVKAILDSAECWEDTYIITDAKHVINDFGKCRILRRPVCCLNLEPVFNGSWTREDYERSLETKKIVYPKAKVLVVDDSVVNLKVMLSLLENYQIKADIASSGEGCLNIVKNDKYDLLLLDQRMPEMDGIETLHRLRMMDGPNKETPALCITGDFGAEVRDELIAAGFDDYIAKPVKSYYLERFLRKYLPDELAQSVVEKKEEEKTKEVEIDPLLFDPVKGCESTGGSEEAYLTILSTYYQEGIRKIDEIKEEYLDSNLSLYTTNVHSLKSSSASVGALGISPLFKELEFAGKDNNAELIQNKTLKVLEQFEKVLEKVKDHLVEKGAFVDMNQKEEVVLTGEEEAIDVSVVESMKDAILKVNLKAFEEELEKISTTNYGAECNQFIKDIKNSYEMFDYGKVKQLLTEFVDFIQS